MGQNRMGTDLMLQPIAYFTKRTKWFCSECLDVHQISEEPAEPWYLTVTDSPPKGIDQQ